MGPAETPTPPRVNTRGSCSVVEPTQYSGQYELLVDGDPPCIVAVERVLEGVQTIHGVPILPHHVRVTIDEVRDPQAQVHGHIRCRPRSHWQLMVIIPKHCKIIWFCSLHRKMKNDLRTMLQGFIGKSRSQLVQILYPKVCNQQLDSWECDFYVMCWIKIIIRVVITDDWNERFKSTYPIPEDTIR
ncbi:hypothetical protein LR48_Vigan07g177700 [Vigna angularis]|uniref:Ubiquitin-like protease family profile domain-containing protein n=1 Tax=Phaseolus angularis TaxID=3914 RepID=A0A0L9UZ77_PHAAN|nr:hypothetical protein LR48_Vigan07g177700 [Vigna angularis]